MDRSVNESAAAGAIADPAVTLDGGMVAPLLGLSPEAFMRRVQRGIIVQRTERGQDEDAGWFRVTFRFRRRRCRIRFNPETGVIVPA
jgi:hypothetical protein